jgi:two-component system, sensor histidine kinase
VPGGRATACVVSPNPADASLAVEFLTAIGIDARSFSGLREVSDVLDERTGCLILVEEALIADDVAPLQEALARLPGWSDVPLIVVAHDVAAIGQIIGNAFPQSGNVTLLERPLNPHTLISAVQVAMRAAARQQQVGQLLAEREQAVHSRDEFLAMLAHELRNPLAPMRNALYVMRILNIQDPLLRQNTEILERQVDHVVRMVDDLMDVARLERGKVSLKKERLDLNRVVASAVESCLVTAQKRGHRVSVRFTTQALPVEGDPVRIEQIVCNLVNNASKFTSQPDEIVVATSADAGFANVVVEDRGIGFQPETAERLFEPFLQMNPTLERAGGGLGMGLTIVRRLAELHEGDVRASSKGVGHGASFRVRLPLARAPAEAAQPLPAKDNRRIVRRVAVIEDNPDIRETMRVLLTLWGHEVVVAADGQSGVELITREWPDVALVDVGLPGMNGYEVARAIRRERPNGIRLIAVTGYGQPSDVEEALQAGFDAHLLKPISPETLKRFIVGAA